MSKWMLLLKMSLLIITLVGMTVVTQVESMATQTPNISVSRSSGKGTFTPGEIIFEEEFNSLNTSLWKHEINMNGGYNGEFQIYDDYKENAYVQDGILFIKPTLSVDTVFGGSYEKLYNGSIELEGCTDPEKPHCSHKGSYPQINPPIVSARLRTQGTFSFRYGRIEVRARLPSADWTWPAIWLLPEEDIYGGWPRSGEIDIMESRGNRKLFNEDGSVNIGCEQTASTLHFGPEHSQNGMQYAHGERNSQPDQGYDREFHVFACEWTPNKMTFTVDNAEVKIVEPPEGGFWEVGHFDKNGTNPWANAENLQMAPFDQNFHFVLNVATGGAYFPQNSKPAPPWDSNPFLNFSNARDSWLPTWSGERAAMAIDYIRVYAI